MLEILVTIIIKKHLLSAVFQQAVQKHCTLMIIIINIILRLTSITVIHDQILTYYHK